MYQLLLATLAIVLTALVTVGGISYMNPDFGIRRTTTENVTTSYRSFDGAVSAYRISNAGTRPPASVPAQPSTAPAGEPWASLRPYLAGSAAGGGLNGSMVNVQGMDWVYGVDPVRGAFLCLRSRPGETVGPAIREGLALATERVSNAFVGSACLDGTPSSSPQDPYSLTFMLQSGQ